MSRADTLSTSSWRVQVRRRADGIITHGSKFRSLEKAKDYYDSVSIPGSEKSIEVRAAGESRYVRLLLQVMPEVVS